MEKRIKPRALSGYPEWLPEARLVELKWLDQIRAVFESYGYGSIDPRSVEEVEALVSKGEGQDTDKEIYALNRLAGPPAESDPKLALHFDLTVPLARYVAQNYAALVFPFKRYQIQRAWRGERPQEGRFREFYQCDIDVIDNEKVSLHFDVEMPQVVLEVLDCLAVGPIRLHVNNRKILEGFYRGLGIDDPVAVLRAADKLDKIGAKGVRDLMVGTLGMAESAADACLRLAQVRAQDATFVDAVLELGVQHPLLEEGLGELKRVIEGLAGASNSEVVADLSIARGLDYYTGTVYEGKLAAFPGYPSVCSGGRYDNLVGGFLNRKLPGIGMSIGLTRIFAKLLKEGLIPNGPKGPTQVLVVFPSWSTAEQVRATAQRLRRRGLNVETHYEAGKLEPQLRYASRKGIPYVWFISSTPDKPDEVKSLANGQQTAADADSWRPATG